jgi:hypothetical protein
VKFVAAKPGAILQPMAANDYQFITHHANRLNG